MALKANKHDFCYEDAVQSLIREGFDETAIRHGSIPEKSLTCVGGYLFQQFNDSKREVLGLHIGNFVGISLSYFAALVKQLTNNARIVAIDPNISHRGIHHPHERVIELLKRYDLLDLCLFISGYSMAPPENPQNGYNALANLTMFTKESFDFVVIDGNHDIEYLKTEVTAIRKLLKPGGSIIFDDVNIAYVEIWSYIQQLKEDRTLEFMFEDGRIACFKKKRPSHDGSFDN